MPDKKNVKTSGSNKLSLSYRNKKVVVQANGIEMSPRFACLFFPKYAEEICAYSKRAKQIDATQKDFIDHEFFVDNQTGTSFIKEVVCLDNEIFSQVYQTNSQPPKWFDEKVELFMSKHNLYDYDRREAGAMFYLDGQLVGKKYFLSLMDYLNRFEIKEKQQRTEKSQEK